MGSLRLAAAVALLVASVGAAATAYVAWTPDAGESGAYAIKIEGPDGGVIFDGVAHAENATVLTLLEAAAELGSFALVIDAYPGMGAYVRSIDGHEAHGASGWVYEIQRDGAWQNGDRSAAHQPLREGDAVRWRWTEG